jgi:hypothetical protein
MQKIARSPSAGCQNTRIVRLNVLRGKQDLDAPMIVQMPMVLLYGKRIHMIFQMRSV